LYQSADFQKDNVILSFTNVGSGLMVKDKFGYVKGFEVAGEDKKFVFAKAEIKGDNIIVYAPIGIKPIAVRYAWSDSPDDANVFNKEGFPLSSFRTDTWKSSTEGVMFK
jgi:sialate O-acetylesterase